MKQQRVSQDGSGLLGEDSLAELVRLRKRGGGVADGGVMCSNDLWSCGSRRRHDERGIANVAAQRTNHGVPHAVSCRLLGVSESWFYKWRSRRAELDIKVRAVFETSNRTYGSPRV